MGRPVWAVLVSCASALGTTAPDGSVTVPITLPADVVCAAMGTVIEKMSAAAYVKTKARRTEDW